MMTDRLYKDCERYSIDLGNLYRVLYMMKATGADKTSIKAQKAKIKSLKRRLKNTINQGESSV